MTMTHQTDRRPHVACNDNPNGMHPYIFYRQTLQWKRWLVGHVDQTGILWRHGWTTVMVWIG